jgi:hypothetical protein
MIPNEKTPQKPLIFSCNFCDFHSANKKDYKKHLETKKHKTKTTPIITPNYKCLCGKVYAHLSSRCAHKKKCEFVNKTKNIESENESEKSEEHENKESNIILELIKQNEEFKKLLLEQNNKLIDLCKNGTHIVNSNNKTFNLNVFLNEECKHAMNLTDFVDSLQIHLTDLEKIGELGYVNGISNIIIQNLKVLDVHKRPVHCSDAKRETIYIKDSDKWEKENEEKNKLQKAIQTIANKNIRMIPAWREKNPECVHSESHKSDQYNNIIIQSMDTDVSSNQKIIKNIAKEIKI